MWVALEMIKSIAIDFKRQVHTGLHVAGLEDEGSIEQLDPPYFDGRLRLVALDFSNSLYHVYFPFLWQLQTVKPHSTCHIE